jgi:hypothetical protein
MSDAPSPETPRPKLNLAAKGQAAPAPTPAPVEEEAGDTEGEAGGPPPLQAASSATPSSLSGGSDKPRPSFRLQGNPHPAHPDKIAAAGFRSPMPTEVEDAPSPVLTVLAGLAAVAACAFAYLLYVKSQ